MINKKLIEKYIKCCIVLLFTANLYSMEGDIAKNIADMSFLQQYYNITRPLTQLIIDGMDDVFMNTIIQNQIHVNFIDESGQTPLILACRLNNLKLVKFILTNGGIIDFTDLNGKSALCYAQENANNEIIDLLIENNRNSKICDSKVDKRYKCNVKDCPYTTNGKYYFKVHMLAHNSKNCYKCNVEGCGYIAASQSSLNSHTQRNHPGVDVSYKYYKCKIEGCLYTTNSKLFLEAHMLAHQSENCYKCNVEGCGYISTKKYNLNSHTRRHHPENNDNARNKSSSSENKLFKCTKCKFESTSKRKLDFHVLSHNPVSKKIKKDYNKDQPK